MWSTLRRSRFVLAAVLFHLGFFALLPRHRPRPAMKPAETELLWIEDTPPNESAKSLAPNVTGSERATVTATESVTGTVSATGTEKATGTATGTESALEPPPATSSSSAPLSSLFIPDRASVGLDGPGSYRLGAAKEGVRAGEQTESQRVSEVTRQAIVDPIRAHEQQNGGAGGPVVVALEQTARHGLTPNFGHAVFAIRVDALGVVVSVGVEDASSDRREWEAIATESLAALAQKRVHLPPGSKGAQIRVEITSRVQMPSGSTQAVTVRPGGAADPGSSTLPIVSGSFDVSDIGAHPLRVVGARELSETIF